MISSDIQEKFNINRIRKDLLNYFKNDKFKIDIYDINRNEDISLKVDINDELHLINFIHNISLKKEIVVIPFKLNIAIGNNVLFEDGSYSEAIISFSLEYNDYEELVSISW